MAIIEWKGQSGIGSHLNGNMKLDSESDAKVYDECIKGVRSIAVNLFLIISISFTDN